MRLKLERCPFLLMLAAGTMPLVAVIDCKSPADGLLVWPMLFVLAAVVCLFLPGRARLPAAICWRQVLLRWAHGGSCAR